jgi:hypothetical protein
MRLPPEQLRYYKQKYSDYAYDEQKENRLKKLVRDRFDQGSGSSLVGVLTRE